MRAKLIIIILFLMLIQSVLSVEMINVKFYSDECGIIKSQNFKIGRSVLIPKDIDFIILDREYYYNQIIPVNEGEIITLDDGIKKPLNAEMEELFYTDKSVLVIRDISSVDCTTYTHMAKSQILGDTLKIDADKTGISLYGNEKFYVCLDCEHYRAKIMEIDLTMEQQKLDTIELEFISDCLFDLTLKNAENGEIITPREAVQIEVNSQCQNNITSIEPFEYFWRVYLRGGFSDIFEIKILAPGYNEKTIYRSLEDLKPDLEIELEPSVEMTKLNCIIDKVFEDTAKVIIKAPEKDIFYDRSLKNFRLHSSFSFAIYAGVANFDEPNVPLAPKDFSIGFEHTSFDKKFNPMNLSIRYFAPFGIYAEYDMPISISDRAEGWFLSPFSAELISANEPINDTRISILRGGMRLQKFGDYGIARDPFIYASYLWSKFYPGELSMFEEDKEYYTAMGLAISSGVSLPLSESVSLEPALMYAFGISGDAYYYHTNGQIKEPLSGSGSIGFIAFEMRADITLKRFMQQ